MQYQRQLERRHLDGSPDLVAVLEEASFEDHASRLRLDSQQPAFLDHQVDRQIVHLLADNEELRGGRGAGVVLERERDLARVAAELELALPLVLETVPDGSAARGRVDLRGTDLPERELRRVAGLAHLAGHGVAGVEARLEARRP